MGAAGACPCASSMTRLSIRRLFGLLAGGLNSSRPRDGSCLIADRTLFLSLFRKASPCKPSMSSQFIEGSSFTMYIAFRHRICWPFRGDQPVNAATLSTRLNVAYELFEVRNGEHGLGRILRLGGTSPRGTVKSVRQEMREVLVKLKGSDGSVKRANAIRIRDEIQRSWESDGESSKELQKLFDILDGKLGKATG